MRTILILACALAVSGCVADPIPDEVMLGTAIRNCQTNPVAKNGDWAVDYVSIQLRWRLKPLRSSGE